MSYWLSPRFHWHEWNIGAFNCHAQEQYSCLCKWIGMCTCLETSGGIKYQFFEWLQGGIENKYIKVFSAFSTYTFFEISLLGNVCHFMSHNCAFISQCAFEVNLTVMTSYSIMWLYILQYDTYFATVVLFLVNAILYLTLGAKSYNCNFISHNVTSYLAISFIYYCKYNFIYYCIFISHICDYIYQYDLISCDCGFFSYICKYIF